MHSPLALAARTKKLVHRQDMFPRHPHLTMIHHPTICKNPLRRWVTIPSTNSLHLTPSSMPLPLPTTHHHFNSYSSTINSVLDKAENTVETYMQTKRNMSNDREPTPFDLSIINMDDAFNMLGSNTQSATRLRHGIHWQNQHGPLLYLANEIKADVLGDRI